MTFCEYKTTIDSWTRFAKENKITLSNKKELPITFWKTFLGLTRKQHQDMYRGTFKNRSGCIPSYVAQAIRFATLLPKKKFIQEIKNHITLFEEDKVS